MQVIDARVEWFLGYGNRPRFEILIDCLPPITLLNYGHNGKPLEVYLTDNFRDFERGYTLYIEIVPIEILVVAAKKANVYLLKVSDCGIINYYASCSPNQLTKPGKELPGNIAQGIQVLEVLNRRIE
jgi:hypothetical protein